jgi:3'-phosphoadenosine 5'-phosphosulfate (PAPS) 3'-phosphatase
MLQIFASSKYASELEFMYRIIRQAGTLLLQGKDKGTEVTYKADNSIVTQVDHECALFLDGEIEKSFPSDAILNEETYHLAKGSAPWHEAKRCWILDPLDSTSSYIRNGQHYGVIMALALDGKPVVGMTYKPELGEIYFAAKGEGAFRAFAGPEPELVQVLPVKVSDQTKLHLILSHGRQKTPELVTLLKRLGNPTCHRMSGSLKINEVSRGEYSAFVSPPQNPMCLWDLGAPQIILEEAGGCLSDLQGKPLDYRDPNPVMMRGLIASNGKSHSIILDKLAASSHF